MVDTIAIVDDGLIEQMSMNNAEKSFLLLEQGSKTEALSISTHCGGGAINAAVSFARLGYDVATIAKIGDDARGAQVRETLAKERISDRFVKTGAGAPTGASSVISAHDRNAAIFTFRGANTMLGSDDLSADAFDAGIVYVSTLSGQSADMLTRIIELAHGRGAFIVVNPGIRQITGRFAGVTERLSDVSLLAVNRLEAEAMLRQAVLEMPHAVTADLRTILAHAKPGQQPADRKRTLAAFARAIGNLGAKGVLLTDGKRGAYLCANDQVLFCPAIDVKVAGTAGAGDAFVSTLAGFLASGAAPGEAVAAATVNAGSVVQYVDAQTGLLSRAALDRHLAIAHPAVETL